MAIDPAGTQPGLAAPAPEAPKIVHIKCKRPGCTSINATEMTPPNSQGRHLYRCTECGQPHGIVTGGAFDL